MSHMPIGDVSSTRALQVLAIWCPFRALFRLLVKMFFWPQKEDILLNRMISRDAMEVLQCSKRHVEWHSLRWPFDDPPVRSRVERSSWALQDRCASSFHEKCWNRMVMHFHRGTSLWFPSVSSAPRRPSLYKLPPKSLRRGTRTTWRCSTWQNQLKDTLEKGPREGCFLTLNSPRPADKGYIMGE